MPHPDVPSLKGELFVVSPADGRLCPVWLERHEDGPKSILLLIGHFGDLSREVPVIYRPRPGTDSGTVNKMSELLDHAGYHRQVIEFS